MAMGTAGGSSPDKEVSLCPKVATSILPRPLSVPGQQVTGHVRVQMAPSKGCGQPSQANGNAEKPTGPRRNWTFPEAPQPAHDPGPSTSLSPETQKSCPWGGGSAGVPRILLQDRNDSCHHRGCDPHPPPPPRAHHLVHLHDDTSFLSRGGERPTIQVGRLTT